MAEAQGQRGGQARGQGKTMNYNTDSLPQMILAVFVACLFIGSGLALFGVLVQEIYFRIKGQPPMRRTGKIAFVVFVIIFAVTGRLIYGK